MAATTALTEFDAGLAIRAEEASIIVELKAGSERAYDWLITRYHQPIYRLISSLLSNPADAADTTQEVFLKICRGMSSFRGGSSLKTWMYKIAIRESSNHRRWWGRHKAQEISLETPQGDDELQDGTLTLEDTLKDPGASPFENTMKSELRARVVKELWQMKESYRIAVILRDINGLSYEEIAQVTNTSLATVKTRLSRGRGVLKERLAGAEGASPK